MGLFKADFYRFFTLGFAIGAVIVVASVGGDFGALVSRDVVPAAQAHAAR